MAQSWMVFSPAKCASQVQLLARCLNPKPVMQNRKQATKRFRKAQLSKMSKLLFQTCELDAHKCTHTWPDIKLSELCELMFHPGNVRQGKQYVPCPRLPLG